MSDLSSYLYVANLLLFAVAVLLYRILKILRDISQIKRNSDISLQIASDGDIDRREMKKLFEFLVEEQVKSRDALHTIKNLEETILHHMPTYRKG